MGRRRVFPRPARGLREAAPMFRLRTALTAFALIVGFGSTGHAQMQHGGGFGQGGFTGGFGGFQPGLGGQSFGAVGGAAAVVGPVFPYGYGYSYNYGVPFYDYGAPFYPAYGYWPVLPQTSNAMGPLMN